MRGPPLNSIAHPQSFSQAMPMAGSRFGISDFLQVAFKISVAPEGYLVESAKPWVTYRSVKATRNLPASLDLSFRQYFAYPCMFFLI